MRRSPCARGFRICAKYVSVGASLLSRAVWPQQPGSRAHHPMRTTSEAVGISMTFVAVAHFVIRPARLFFAGSGTLGVFGAGRSTPFDAALLAPPRLLFAVPVLLALGGRGHSAHLSADGAHR